MKKTLVTDDYRALATFRHGIRSYIRFSERYVRNAGLEPRQYQLLLAMKGIPNDISPRIAELAHQLQIQHHSAVELVNRSEGAGLVRRERSTRDRREVLLRLTPAGDEIIEKLVKAHLGEVFARGPHLQQALQTLLSRDRTKQRKAK